jgi:hypothetical protein
MAKQKGWVLAEIGWEYNDEYNYRPEYGGSKAQAVYLEKGDADAECERLNCIGIRGAELGSYGGDGLNGVLSRKVSTEEFLEWANKTLKVEWTDDSYPFEVPEGLSHAVYKGLLERVSIRFWEVLEVEVR